MKILDCTLRDGGYYNNWDFEYESAKKLILELNNAGIDIIEIGYKSPASENFYGLFKYCNEELLQYLKDYTTSEYAFMIDVKDFLIENTINYELLDKLILPQADSVFSWVRVASHFVSLNSVPDFIAHFKNKGYKVCFNLMGGSLLSDQQLLQAIALINPVSPEVFYIADSFGSFYPDDIRRLVKLIKENFNGKVGIHTHDNQGMAFSNTLAGIEAGADFVDGTVTGMGRGAGNLVLEQFLQKYAEDTKNPRYKPNALLEIIGEFIQPLKDQYQWGYNYVYMLSGLKNIHPTYCQKLSEGNRYSKSQISSILEAIPVEHRSKFNKMILQEAINHELNCVRNLEGKTALPPFVYKKINSVLILARGESVKKHEFAIRHLVAMNDTLIIDCNNTGFLAGTKNDRVIAIVNQVKLNQYLNEEQDRKYPLITGQCNVADVVSRSNLFYEDFALGDFGVDDGSVSIPDYDTGLYAVALALKFRPEHIWLAGLDGFEDTKKNKKFDGYFAEAVKKANELGIEIACLTPSKYKSIQEMGIYALLN